MAVIVAGAGAVPDRLPDLIERAAPQPIIVDEIWITFDATAAGAVARRAIIGEGAAAIILVKRELLSSPAILISGAGTSNDANHLTGPSRDGSGLALAIQRTLTKAEIAPDEIDYIHAHGTATPDCHAGGSPLGQVDLSKVGKP